MNLQINTNKNTYNLGEQINGNVLFSNFKDLYNFNLKCELLGIEEVFWVNQRTITNGEGDEKSTETVYDEFTDNRIIIKNQHTLESLSLLNKGEFSKNFSFTLDYNLPGSFNEKWNDYGYDCKANINYYLRFFIESDNKIIKTTEKKINLIQFNNDIKHKTEHKKKIKINYLCKKYGEINFNLKFDQNLKIGEENEIILEFDNTKCLLDIKNFKLELIRKLDLISSKGNKTINNTILTRRKEGILSGNKIFKNNNIVFTIDKDSQNKIIYPSIKSEFIINKYYFSLNINYDHICNFCISKNINFDYNLIDPNNNLNEEFDYPIKKEVFNLEPYFNSFKKDNYNIPPIINKIN